MASGGGGRAVGGEGELYGMLENVLSTMTRRMDDIQTEMARMQARAKQQQEQNQDDMAKQEKRLLDNFLCNARIAA